MTVCLLVSGCGGWGSTPRPHEHVSGEAVCDILALKIREAPTFVIDDAGAAWLADTLGVLTRACSRPD